MMKSIARWAGALQVRVFAHAEGLAERDRGDGVGVHLRVAVRLEAQVAVGLLVLDQPVDPFADRRLVLAR